VCQKPAPRGSVCARSLRHKPTRSARRSQSGAPRVGSTTGETTQGRHPCGVPERGFGGRRMLSLCHKEQRATKTPRDTRTTDYTRDSRMRLHPIAYALEWLDGGRSLVKVT